jgi:hypothetical protein
MRTILASSFLFAAWLSPTSTGIPSTANSSALVLAGSVSQPEISQELSSAVAKSWRGEKVENLTAAIHDGKEETYIVLTPGKEVAEIGVGLEWNSPVKVDGLEVHYATLNGTAYEPLPGLQKLQYWDGNQWRALGSTVRIDYRPEGKLAAYQGSGWVSWSYRFKPVEGRGIRLLLSKTPSQFVWRQRYVIREFKPFFSAEGSEDRAGVTVVRRSGLPGPDEALINWGSPEQGASRSQDAEGTLVSWPRPKLVDEVVLPVKELPGPLQWWDEQKWRDIPITRLETSESRSAALKATFLPVAVKKLRLANLPASIPLQINLSRSGREYFERVYRSGPDMLMERILRAPEEPDFAGVASLLLPLDMHTSVMGRPGDLVECLVHWNGTLVEIENGDKGAWNTGAKESDPGKNEWVDRWVAFAAAGELFGTDINRTSRSYLDGFLPAVVTLYQKDGINFEEEVFTTAPDDSIYAQVVTLRVSNPGKVRRRTSFSLLMGRRWSAIAGHRRGPDGDSPSPMNFDPMITGYRVEPDRRIIRSPSGEIVLYAEAPFQWGGVPRENILSYELQMEAGQSREFHFVIPSVNAPVKESAAVQKVSVKESREGFRKYWRQLLEGNSRLDLPEQPLNDLYKNLLAQAMITLRDGQKLKYGAYWYEDYFGVEEGWPIVALAQYGHRDQAQSAIEIMLSPQLMDKSNYHHQYRNGLAAMYASQVYRLSRDRQWLASIKPRLVEMAEWTMKTRRQSETGSGEYRGLLPKHAYGGDISTPAYSLYSNATCWRGLQDTGSLLRELEDKELGERYLKDAGDYRRTIDQAATQNTNHQVSPPFVPLAFEIGSPGSKEYKKVETPYPFIPADPLGNYWILFTPLLLETGVFPAGSANAQAMRDTMEQNGGLLAGLARFYRGLDHIYGFGYPLQLLEKGDRRRYQGTVYSTLAHGGSRDSYTTPEGAGVFPLRTSNLNSQELFHATIWNWDLYGQGWFEEGFGGSSLGSEPLSAGAGTALQLIRKMIINEELDADALPTGTLELLKMAPSRWLEDGKKIVIEKMPTYFGEVSLSLRSQLASGKISGRYDAPALPSLKKAVLWLRHPAASPIRAVRFNGQSQSGFGADSITLPATGVVELEVEFEATGKAH